MAYFGLKCPECRKSFRYDPKDEHPRFCPLCRADIGGNTGDDTVISIPAFLSAKSKATDQVYRDIERSSEHRAQQAAQLAGCDVAEMANMKVTNIADARKPGQVAAIPVVNDITRQMDAMQAAGLPTGFGVPNAAELASAIKTGPYPNAGAKTMANIQKTLGR